MWTNPRPCWLVCRGFIISCGSEWLHGRSAFYIHCIFILCAFAHKVYYAFHLPKDVHAVSKQTTHPRTGPQREREREREKGRGREFVVVRNCCMVDLPFTFTTLHLVCICSWGVLWFYLPKDVYGVSKQTTQEGEREKEKERERVCCGKELLYGRFSFYIYYTTSCLCPWVMRHIVLLSSKRRRYCF